MSPRRLLSGIIGLAVVQFAAATETLNVGHLALSTPGGGAVLIEVGAAEVELSYRDFSALSLEAGDHVVRVIDAVDGSVLAERSIVLNPDYSLTPLLYFAGNGGSVPYRIELDQRLRPPDSAPPGSGVRVRFSVHHEAPGPSVAGVPQDVRLEIDCVRPVSPLPVGFGYAYEEIGYGLQWRETLGDVGVVACDVLLGSADAGGFSFRFEQSAAVATRRAFLIGDGETQPSQVLIIDGSAQVALLDLPPAQPRALAESRDHWFDLRRPDQGLSLFEVGGTGIVFGTWFTVGDDNLPTWFYFEGAKVQGIGRRDIIIYAGSRASGLQALQPVGSARLQYLDCNEAEFRVLLGEATLRTVRARRSQPVSFCPVFD